jgi:hypothetical protein
MNLMKAVIPAIVICLAVAALGTAGADEPDLGWKTELVANLNLTQASFNNWAQGGENTLGWQMAVNGKFTHAAERHEWANTIKLAYGSTKIGDEEARKSVDEGKLETVYIYKAGFFVDPYVAATAETQLSRGYDYDQDPKEAISHFVDPGFFSQSIGIGRSYKGILRSRLGFQVKETIADEFAARYTDDIETPDEIEDRRVDYGVESVTDLELKLEDNLLFTSKLELFSDLSATKEIDVKWDNLLTAKVAEYVQVTLNVKMLYDRDILTPEGEPFGKAQIKQSLALGLTYSFM